MIVLIRRTYIFLHARTPRSFVALAVGALVAVLVAGCGSGGGGSTTPTASVNATPTPTPSGVDLGVGSQVGNSGRAVGKISKGSAGSVTRQHLHGVTKGTAGTISHVSINSILSKKALDQAQKRRLAAEKAAVQAAQKAAEKAAAERAAANRRKATHKTRTPVKPPTISNPTTITVTVREKTPAPPAKSTVRTVTKTVVKTVNHTVTKTVPPNVPAGAFLPSKQPVLAQDSFTVPGSNVVCQIAAGGIRCGILRRAWAAPVQPASCKGSWGDTLELQRQGLPKFVCGGNSPLSANAKVIPVGWDDQIDGFTCQVRSFGVNCFSPARRGFILSRTGYAFY
jgi:hypothetical protein